MADNVKIETVACSGNNCISVNKHLIKTKKKSVIKFKNDLTGGVDANIQFFDADDKGSTTPLTGFCEEEPGQTLIAEPFSTAGKKICTVDADVGDYAYTIKAANHIDLDPIIIIEPSVVDRYMTASKSGSDSVSPIICIIIPVVAALIAFWLGSRVRSSSG